MMVFSGHADAVSCGGFTPDGKKVYSGSADASVKGATPHNTTTTAMPSASSRRVVTEAFLSL